MSELLELARSYRRSAEELKSVAQADRDTLSADMLLGTAETYEEMAETAEAIERTYLNLYSDKTLSTHGYAPLSSATSDDMDRFAWVRLASDLRGVVFGLLASLGILTVATWALSINEAIAMNAPMGISANDMGGIPMPGMPAAAWTISSATAFVVIWTMMMAAMMLPAMTPMLMVFVAVKTRSGQAAAVPTWMVVAGYLFVWVAAGLLVYVLVQIGSDVATGLVPEERPFWVSFAQAATLIAAGLYQFTPLKRICLRHCRSIAFVMQHWREGRIAAFKLGFQHGVYCFGCCWMLFAIQIAAGVMSLAWMVLLTFLIFVERSCPRGRVVSPVAGFVLVALGTAIGTGELPHVPFS